MLIHAAGLSSEGNIPLDTRAVALGVSSESELFLLAKKLEQHNIKHVVFHEPDRANEMMAIGVFPCPKSKVKHILSKYPLVK